eukprot:SAG22_NODE_3145_length_1905_cov_1.920266_2_plen_38_part_01
MRGAETLKLVLEQERRHFAYTGGAGVESTRCRVSGHGR